MIERDLILKRISFIFVFCFLVGVGFSSYYADVEIFVDEFGRTTISGITNHPDLIDVNGSELFTSKDGKYWIFDLGLNESKFSNFVFKLSLPKNVETNYIKTTKDFRISQKEDRIFLLGYGKEQNFNLVVQYSFNSNLVENVESSALRKFLAVFVAGVLSWVLVYVGGIKFYRRYKNKRKKSKKKIIIDKDEDKDKNRVDEKNDRKYLVLNLNSIQIEIIEILEKFGEISQKDLELKLKIPKSSVSRNLRMLVLKKVVKVEKCGISNIISLVRGKK